MNVFEEDGHALIYYLYRTNNQYIHDVPRSITRLVHSLCTPFSYDVSILPSYGWSLECMLDLMIGMLVTPHSQVIKVVLPQI